MVLPLFGLGGGLLVGLPLVGREVLQRTAHSMAVSLCQPYRGSKRYHRMVEYYSWKLERRYAANAAVRGWAACHDAAVALAVAYQLVRLLQLAVAIWGAVK